MREWERVGGEKEESESKQAREREGEISIFAAIAKRIKIQPTQ